MKKYAHSKILCFLLVLVLLIQNLAVTAFANDDVAEDYCPVSADHRHNREGYDTIPETCTTPGLKGGSYCSACNKVFSAREEIPATGHTTVIDPAVAATCTTDGKTAGSHCSVCNAVLVAQEVIPAEHGELEILEPSDPTCTEPGSTGGERCTVCGEFLVVPEVLPAHGHEKVVTVPAIAATCKEAGRTEGWKCIIEDCGYVVASEVIPAADHTVVVDPAVAATCTTPGKTAGSHCAVCGLTLVPQDEIPVVSHTVVVDEAVAATCTTEGKTAGSHCSVCDKVLIAQEPIPATGHTVVTDAAVKATCIANGRTEGSHCSVCGDILVLQRTIPMSGFHQVIPSKQLNPDSDPLECVCTVCGEKWTGFVDSSTYALSTYERVDWSSALSGFNLTVGDSPLEGGNANTAASEIAAGELMVYQSEDGDYVNLLCLISEDSTMTYFSFESGSTNIGEMVLASQNNPNGGAIKAESGQSVDQLGLGIGVDENGKAYLYVIENGEETSFTVTGEVDENGRNSVVLSTENESQITIESNSIGYQIQSDEEGAEQSGTRLEMESTTTEENASGNTAEESEPVAVEIVFSIKYLSEPAQEQNTQPIQEFDEQEQPEQTIQSINENENETDNSTFVIHKYEEPTAPNFVRDAGQSFVRIIEDPNAQTTSAAMCDHSQGWKSENGKCVCKSCGKQNSHNFKPTDIVKCRCANCGQAERHTWENGICSRCGLACSHISAWHEEGSNCVCNICGFRTEHRYARGFTGNRCRRCLKPKK